MFTWCGYLARTECSLMCVLAFLVWCVCVCVSTCGIGCLWTSEQSTMWILGIRLNSLSHVSPFWGLIKFKLASNSAKLRMTLD